ncbi:MAG: inositol monophosphatase family protein, partial [Fidelibacterota bacterium]
AGAAAIDLCHVACGWLDGFWEHGLQPWDTAAGILIVQEAGGNITKNDNSKYSIFDKEIVASNGKLHKEMLTLIESTITKQ